MAQTIRHLSLLMPGLLTSVDAAQLRVRELETLLARSEQGVCATDPDALLFELFGLATEGMRNVPVAPLTHALDAETSSGYWLHADPCYMRADNNRVLMLGNDFLNIDQSEADALAHELAPLFRGYDWQFSAPRPKRWYLRLPEDPGIRWHSLSTVRGEDIHRFLPGDAAAGADAKLWRRILNEAQMILHHSPVNHGRAARDELPINSLWFWGGGSLPQVSSTCFAQVWGDGALEQGLAKHFALPCAPSPIDAATWLSQAVLPGEHLVVVEPGSGLEKENTIESLNQNWFAPLLAALKARKLASLHLYTGNGSVFHVSPRSAARWWKRPHGLLAYLPNHEQVLK